MRQRQREGPSPEAWTARARRELGMLLISAQLLTLFLLVTLFTDRVHRLSPYERSIHLTALMTALTSALLFSGVWIARDDAPTEHGWVRLRRARTRLVIAGRLALTLAIMLTTDAVMGPVGGAGYGVTWALIVGFFLTITMTDPPVHGRDEDEDR